MEYLYVRNWSKFQHYHDRNPPWIKLHFELLSSQDWVMLADASKALAVACMLLASRDGGRIPHDEKYIKRVAYMESVDFKPLLECGFLASKQEQMLATARPETETYSEYREETEKRKKNGFSKTWKGNGHDKQRPLTGAEEGKRIAEKLFPSEGISSLDTE